jgi:hypothetical protein
MLNTSANRNWPNSNMNMIVSVFEMEAKPQLLFTTEKISIPTKQSYQVS